MAFPLGSRTASALVACFYCGLTFSSARPLEIFEGVRFELEQRKQPRPLKLYWLEIHLRTPGVTLEVSPDNGAEPGEVDANAPLKLLREQKWQALINGDAFRKMEVAGEPTYPTLGAPLDLQGAAIRNGHVISKPRKGYGVFYIRRNGTMGVTYPPLPKDVRDAIGGYRIVLREGKVTGKETKLHPRTAVGFNNKSGTVYWLIVDGRQGGHSEGATEKELGEWMKARGATGALSLDGGGSSLMVIDQGKKPRVVNRPVGTWNLPGTVRPVGNCLGLKAPPLQSGQ